MSLATRITDLATRVATEFKTVKTMISGSGTGDVSGLQTTATNLVAAVNEVRATANAAAVIDDGAASASKVWSSQKTNTEITTAVAAVVASSPAALDTLNELAGALGNDANFATTTATALGNRVRADAAQTFTAPQQAQARSNIDAASLTGDLGDPNTDFVAQFTAALA